MTKVCKGILFSILFIPFFISAQDSTSKLIFSGYVDAYVAHYTDSVGQGNFQKFPSISPRSDNFGLNIAMITAKYSADRIRSTVSLHYGDIPQSAWAVGYNNFIQEANAGIRLCKNLWIDAGFFRTHFGTEGLLPKENICSSVSVCTFYEPYFEAGVKLSYTPNDKLSIALYGLNGYGIFQDNNYKKSFGALITYAFNDKLNIGYSNYIGDDTPLGDTIKHTRIHQNLFVNYQIKNLKIQVGGDYCMQKNSMIADPKKTGSMYAGVISLKYQFVPKFALYARYEIFNDPEGFMSGIFTDNKGLQTGFKLWGLTGGMEFKPMDNAYIRFEVRQLMMDPDQEIFWWYNKMTNGRTELMAHMGISF